MFMQLKARQIANLLALAILSLSVNQAGLAQAASYGAPSFAKVLSVTENRSGNFLLLKLESSFVLPAPKIQYLPGPDGKTVMVSDFSGLIWPRESQMLRPEGSAIETIRFGQFQSYPPVFRIAVTTANPALLKNLEFKCRPDSLLIKLGNPDNFPDLAGEFEEWKKRSVDRQAGKNKNQYRKVLPTRDKTAPAGLAELSGNGTFRSGGLYKDIAAKTTNSDAAKSSLAASVTGAAQFNPVPAPDFRAENFLKTESTTQQQLKQTSQPLSERPPQAKFEMASKRKSETEPGYKLLAPLKDRTLEPEETNPKFIAGQKAQTPVSTISENSNLGQANPILEFSGAEPYLLKLKFVSGPPLKYRAFRLVDPPRYVLDIDNPQGLAPQDHEPEPNEYLKAVRFGAQDEKNLRVVLDLADSGVQVNEKLSQENSLLSLVFSKSTPAQGRRFTVLIDAGHGGSDPGAQRGEIQEKDITLAIANRLKRHLEKQGLKVFMTRNDDSFVSLEDRVKMTNEMSPDAFVSVHINSLETDRDIQGIETYYQTEQSLKLAELVHKELVNKLSVPDRSVRKARFYVVNHTERPAILAEVGFISNKEERDKLISSDYQAKVAESLGEGVILFLSNRAEHSTETAMQAKQLEANSKNSPGSLEKKTLAKDGLNAVKHLAVSSSKNASAR